MRRLVPRIFCVAAALAVASCADLALKPDVLPHDMEILPKDTLITAGDELSLTVIVYDEDGNIIDGPPSWAPPRWHANVDGAVDIEPNGDLIGLKGSAVNVTGRLADMEAFTRLRVNPTSVNLSVPVVYFNQVIQNPEATVPILAGRDALLRVFAVGHETSFYEPSVRADFYRDGQVIHTALMEPLSSQLPDRVNESRIDRSYNAEIPGHVLQPGVELVIVLDPEGLVPQGSNSQDRFPAQGTMPLNIVALPTHRQTLVPTMLSWAPDERVYSWTRDVDGDSRHMQDLRMFMPIADIEVIAHETLNTNADIRSINGWDQWIREVRAIWEMEGRQGYYYGAVQLPYQSGIIGYGYVGNVHVSVGGTRSDTFAHEVGHNMSLRHAPCGTNGDPNFPYSDGGSGMWGWDFERDRLVDPKSVKDLMSYCDPIWVSDFHFNKALQYRLSTEGTARPPVPEPETTLMLWGSASDRSLLLEPAFLVEAPPTQPTSGGPYRLEGFGPAGEVRFSFDFTPDPVEYDGAQFHFNLPYDPVRDGALERVVLSGPAGEDSLSPMSAPPMAIVRNSVSGQIRAFLRDWDGTVPAAVQGSTFEIMFSDGIPGGVR